MFRGTAIEWYSCPVGQPSGGTSVLWYSCGTAILLYICLVVKPSCGTAAFGVTAILWYICPNTEHYSSINWTTGKEVWDRLATPKYAVKTFLSEDIIQEMLQKFGFVTSCLLYPVTYFYNVSWLCKRGIPLWKCYQFWYTVFFRKLRILPPSTSLVIMLIYGFTKKIT